MTDTVSTPADVQDYIDEIRKQLERELLREGEEARRGLGIDPYLSTVEGFLIFELCKHGMDLAMVRVCLERVKQREECRAVEWATTLHGYPFQLRSVLWAALKREAIDWLEETGKTAHLAYGMLTVPG